MRTFKEHQQDERAKEKAFYVPSSDKVTRIYAELELDGQVVSTGSYKEIRVKQLIHGGVMYRIEEVEIDGAAA